MRQCLQIQCRSCRKFLNRNVMIESNTGNLCSLLHIVCKICLCGTNLFPSICIITFGALSYSDIFKVCTCFCRTICNQTKYIHCVCTCFGKCFINCNIKFMNCSNLCINILLDCFCCSNSIACSTNICCRSICRKSCIRIKNCSCSRILYKVSIITNFNLL